MRDAGPELDAEVAEKVMRWTVELIVSGRDAFEEWRDPQGWRYGPTPPPYSTDIAAAWQVVDAVGWRVGTANIAIDMDMDMEDFGRGAGTRDAGAERAVRVTIGEHTAVGPAPLAICLAALAAMEA